MIATAMATLAAGPLAWLSFAWLSVAAGQNILLWIQALGPADLLDLGAGSWIVISLAAALPAAFGTAAMGMLGGRFAWARAPLAWALAGLLLASVPAIAFYLLAQSAAASLTLVATGTGCALVSRYFIRWKEPAPQA